MLQALYICFIVWRLTRKEIALRHRVAMFSRRFAGLMAAIVVAAMFGYHADPITYVLLLWGPVGVGEWWALQYARQAHLPGVDGPRLPTY